MKRKMIDKCTLADGIWDILTHKTNHADRHNEIMKLLDKTFKGQLECCPETKSEVKK